MHEAMVRSLRIGKAQHLGEKDAKDRFNRPWITGIFKKETRQSIWLSKTGLMGDEVGDKKNHGGEEKAIFTYPAAHYDYWQNEEKIETLAIGGFGENISIEDLTEEDVCIGDVFEFGEALIQVSQPRRPCWRPARRHKTMDLALRIQRSGKTGWYFRVLKEGYVKTNIPLKLIERPYPEWTITRCNHVMYVEKRNIELARELASCHLLADNWQRAMHKRINGKKSNVEKRVFGPNKTS